MKGILGGQMADGTPGSLDGVRPDSFDSARGQGVRLSSSPSSRKCPLLPDGISTDLPCAGAGAL